MRFSMANLPLFDVMSKIVGHGGEGGVTLVRRTRMHARIQPYRFGRTAVPGYSSKGGYVQRLLNLVSCVQSPNSFLIVRIRNTSSLAS